MTQMTMNGVTTTTTPMQEQYEILTSKIGGKHREFCAYDYRHTNGKLFSCICETLDACREKRALWLEKYKENPTS